MADFDFTITSGAYAGRYQIDLADLTARDAADIRRAVGISLAEVMQQGSADLDVMAGLVWVTRRRTAKALPFDAVADTINYGNVTTDASGDAQEPDPLDPTNAGSGSES